MIHLPNGHRFDFAAASGALGFDGRDLGNGVVRLWKAPFRWLGYLDPRELTIITKTLTRQPRRGNLRDWCPWRCVRLIPGGVVNHVGLTNPGLDWWVRKAYQRVVRRSYRVIVSIAPENTDEARMMAWTLRCANMRDGCIVGIEVNASCPNVDHDASVGHVCDLVGATAEGGLPVLVKLAWQIPYLQVCLALDGVENVAAYDLTNTVPWSLVYPGVPSPLAKYGLEGGVSGAPIARHAREALVAVKAAGVRTPILSGGGITDAAEVAERFRLGADAVALGTIFLRKTWLANQIIREWRASNAY